MLLQKNDVILFQGDSVTDCGRKRENPLDLGTGYPLLIASLLQHRCRDWEFTFLNRGISGNRVRDLEKRWQEDCLDLEPTVVSVLIGINDVWRRYDRNDPTDVRAFATGYRNILRRTRAHSDARILLMEPFVTPYPDDRKAWRADLDPKLEALRLLAKEFEATLVPLDSCFAEAHAAKPGGHYTRDGVHPNPAGHALIAQEWLRATGADTQV